MYKTESQSATPVNIIYALITYISSYLILYSIYVEREREENIVDIYLNFINCFIYSEMNHKQSFPVFFFFFQIRF